MQLLQIAGGTPLEGEVTLGGSKHSVLAVLGTILLAKGKVVIHNFPQISDSHHMLKIIESLGVKVSQEDHVVTLEVSQVSFTDEEMWRVSKLRSSILFLGSILARTGSVSLPKPGGDKLGNRPMDEFLYVLKHFGVEHTLKSDSIEAELTHRLHGHREFDLCSDEFPEMGNNRTVLALILAWANRGRTVMHNSLILPEIIEVCYFLEEISGGYVTIDGIGSDTLTVNSPGIDAIHCTTINAAHTIGPDKCEYAFWIAAASLTKGIITMHHPYESRDFRNAMRWVRAKLMRPAGIQMDVLGYGTYRVDCSPGRSTKAFHLESTAHEFHGIAFDATPVFATMLLNAEGDGSYYCFKFRHERTKWAVGLEKIGAKYEIDANGKLCVTGVEQLYAARPTLLEGGDIRGSSCVLLAALATRGEHVVLQGFEHLQRGMEKPLEKLLSLGANIQTIQE